MTSNNKELTLNEAIIIYLKWKETHTTSAYQPYAIRLKRFNAFIVKAKGNDLLSEIDGDDIVAFHKQMLKQYSPATVAYSSRILRNFFDFFRGRGLSKLNPKEIRPIRFLNKNKDAVTQTDVDEMTKQLDRKYIDDLQKILVIQLLWDTGMRISELLALKIEDLQQGTRKGLYTAQLQTKKAFRYNLVVWGEKTNDLLVSYLGWRLTIDTKNNYLFIPTDRKYRDKNSITSRTVQRWIKKLCLKAGLQGNITPHSFRHGRAHFILEHKGTAVDVQSMLRHKNLNSSLNYMQLNPTQYLTTASKYLNLENESSTMTKGLKILELETLK